MVWVWGHPLCVTIRRQLCKVSSPFRLFHESLWVSSCCSACAVSTFTHWVIFLASNCTTSLISNKSINSAKRNSKPALKQASLQISLVSGRGTNKLCSALSFLPPPRQKAGVCCGSFTAGRDHTTLGSPKEGWTEKQSTSLYPVTLKSTMKTDTHHF